MGYKSKLRKYRKITGEKSSMISNNQPKQDFWNRADQVIDLANKQCDSHEIGEVSASLLYATARFNSFVIASSVANSEQMKKKKADAIKYFLEQYEKMLDENLDDYIKNFEGYFS